MLVLVLVGVIVVAVLVLVLPGRRHGAIWSVGSALVVSLVATGLALFALGLVKGRVAGMALLRSGLQVLLVGGGSAAIGYLIGVLVPRLF